MLAAKADAVVTESVPDAAVRAKKVFVTGSTRCGECHDKMFEEWKPSAHSLAASSPLYLAARKDAGNDKCGDRCHAPLVASLGHEDPVAAEGITCDVCHTLRDPKPSPKGADFRLAIDDMVKYGPRCDLEDHYFHRMGCSKEHATAEICGGCHWWERKGIPVFTEYKEWRDSDDAKKGVVCQDCHMPGEKAPLAEGSPMRSDVKHHGLLGIADDLRKRAVAVEATVKAGEGGAVIVEIAVTNTTAAHYVPSGLPERRLAIRVTNGESQQLWELGRILHDASGEAPFWNATKVGEDTRIAPGATWKSTWTTPAAVKGPVTIEVAWVAFAPSIAAQLGVGESQRVTLAKLDIPTTKLPVSKSFVPPSPGKRTKALKTK